MEYAIFGAIIVAFVSLSAQLKKINKKINKDSTLKKDLSSLINKEVKIELDDKYKIELKGKLISYDKTWFELKEIKQSKKQTITETHFERINKIKSITINNE